MIIRGNMETHSHMAAENEMDRQRNKTEVTTFLGSFTMFGKWNTLQEFTPPLQAILPTVICLFTRQTPQVDLFLCPPAPRTGSDEKEEARIPGCPHRVTVRFIISRSRASSLFELRGSLFSSWPRTHRS